jgi:phospholipid-binding lipoprotein MlaA
MSLKSLLAACLCLLSLGACATRPDSVAANDPWEGYNRSMYKFNTAVDRVTLKPAAKAYKAVTPQFFRSGVNNFIENLQEPWTMVNAVLQAKPNVFFNSVGRFMINSTVGIAGLTDRATKWGVIVHEEDFGQTLAAWGVPNGPYLMLPFFGPSSPRDATGFAANFFFDPVKIGLKREVSVYASYARTATEIGNFRTKALSTIDPILDASDDPYVTVRSAYRQKRAYEISDGKQPAIDPNDDLFEDPATTGTTPAATETPKLEQQSFTTPQKSIDDMELAADAAQMRHRPRLD